MPPLVSEEVEEIQSDDSGLPDFPSRSVDLLGEEAEVVIEEELEEGVAACASSSSKHPPVIPPPVSDASSVVPPVASAGFDCPFVCVGDFLVSSPFRPLPPSNLHHGQGTMSSRNCLNFEDRVVFPFT